MAVSGEQELAPVVGTRGARIADYLSLERNVTLASLAVFLIGMGEELWKIAPQTPFVAAGIIGIIGTIVFAATVEERHAG